MVNSPDNRFGKRHKLCSKTLIDRIFAEGRSFFAYPFRCVWSVAEGAADHRQAEVQVLVSVSKRHHKRAVVRNRIKRRIREAYRMNRSLFKDHPLLQEKRILIAFVYSSKEVLEYSVIEHGVIKAISNIQNNLEKDRDRSLCGVD